MDALGLSLQPQAAQLRQRPVTRNIDKDSVVRYIAYIRLVLI